MWYVPGAEPVYVVKLDNIYIKAELFTALECMAVEKHCSVSDALNTIIKSYADGYEVTRCPGDV